MNQQFSIHRIIGFYGMMGKSMLIIKDPSLVKKILIKDFDFFVNHDADHGVETDRLLSKSLLFLRDEKWRKMRTLLSPIYTSSKLKYTCKLLTKCIDEFIELHKKRAGTEGLVEIETYDVFSRVICDGISNTALGFQSDCVVNQDSELYKIADDIKIDFRNPITTALIFTFPKLFKILRFQIFRKSIHNFFLVNVVNEIQRRIDENVMRPDMLQILVQAKKDENNKISNLNDEDLAAQALLFFLGGIESMTNFVQAVIFDEILAKEIDEMLEQLQGEKISEEQLNQLKFLDMVVNETFRKWPPFKATNRSCSKANYELKDDDTGKSYHITKGTEVFIPIYEIQNDPKYFANPEKFDPFRFNDENKHRIQSGTFLPFSLGPKNCIGSRYALLKAKLLIFNVISNFSIEKCAKTPKTMTISLNFTGIVEKIHVVLRLRKNL